MHFSAKTVNSNSLPFGIRLADDIYLDLPYVAVSTIANRNDIPLDYQGGAQKITKPKQINAVRHNRLAEFDFVPKTDRQAIKDCVTTLAIAYEPEAE